MVQLGALIVFGIIASTNLGASREGFRPFGGMGSPAGPEYNYLA